MRSADESRTLVVRWVKLNSERRGERRGNLGLESIVCVLHGGRSRQELCPMYGFRCSAILTPDIFTRTWQGPVYQSPRSLLCVRRSFLSRPQSALQVFALDCSPPEGRRYRDGFY